MNDPSRTNQELIEENSFLYQKIRELEQAESGRKQADDALRESERRLTEAQKMAHLGFWYWDVKTGYVEWSEEVFKIFRLDPKEFTPHIDSILALSPWPEDHQRNQELINRAIETHDQGFYEQKFLRPDQSIGYYHSTFQGYYDKNGDLLSIFGTVLDITALKRAEAALKESEERYRNVFENHVVVKFLIDPDTGSIIEANEAAVNYYGWSHERLKHMKIQEINVLPPEDIKKEMEKARTKKQINFEFRHRRADGSIRDVEVFSSKIEVKGKDLLHSIIHDITERKRAEEGLREQEIKLSSIFRAAPVGIGMVINWVFREANERLCQMTGYSREELLGQNARMLYSTQEDYDYVGREKYRQIGEKSTGIVETRWKRKDGTVVDINLSSTPLDPNDLAKGLTFTALDITERKQAEEKLRESEERFRALSENAPDIIYTMNLLGAITYVNPSWKRILGHDEEEILGRFFIEFAKEEDKRTYRKLFKSIRDDVKSVNNYIGVMLTKDGKERIFNMNSAFNLDSQGRIISVVGSMKDITEMIDIEKKFHQAQKMEAIGTLAGGIAHDFNNLLSGIIGHAALMKMDPGVTESNQRRLRSIEELVHSASGLTSQLLGFARMGRYEVRTLDINELLEKISTMFGRTRKEIMIHRQLPEDLMLVEADRTQMEQVFMNLFVNAWQAMPGGGDLDIKTSRVIIHGAEGEKAFMNPGAYVKISVTDSGEGMDGATKSRIFEPFFTTKGMGRGTGLGLAMVYGIVKGHNGYINVYSEKGYGTTFNIYLPASERQLMREEEIHRKEWIKGNETILLIDDEEHIIEVMGEILKVLSYIVLVARNGNEAIEIYKKEKSKINLVLLDMIMPGMSGGETFKRLKELNPDVKVILSSGYSINGMAREIMEMGCKSFIQKPATVTELSHKIREVLDKTE